MGARFLSKFLKPKMSLTWCDATRPVGALGIWPPPLTIASQVNDCSGCGKLTFGVHPTQRTSLPFTQPAPRCCMVRLTTFIKSSADGYATAGYPHCTRAPRAAVVHPDCPDDPPRVASGGMALQLPSGSHRATCYSPCAWEMPQSSPGSGQALAPGANALGSAIGNAIGEAIFGGPPQPQMLNSRPSTPEEDAQELQELKQLKKKRMLVEKNNSTPTDATTIPKETVHACEMRTKAVYDWSCIRGAVSIDHTVLRNFQTVFTQHVDKFISLGHEMETAERVESVIHELSMCLFRR